MLTLHKYTLIIDAFYAAITIVRSCFFFVLNLAVPSDVSRTSNAEIKPNCKRPACGDFDVAVEIHCAHGEEEEAEDKLWYCKPVSRQGGKHSNTPAVLPLASSPGGHRLGVNGLAIDEHASILYENPSAESGCGR